MTGPLTLKRRFLGEKFGSANLSFQKKRQFLAANSNFGEFRYVTSFCQQTTTKSKMFQLYWCRVKHPVQKIAIVTVEHFLLSKNFRPNFSHRIFDFTLPILQFYPAHFTSLSFCAFAYKRPNSLVRLNLWIKQIIFEKILNCIRKQFFLGI